MNPHRDRPDPLWRSVVGAVLRAERRRQRLTLREVAGISGISVPYLSELERGRKEASSEMLAAASKALGLRLVDLLARAHQTLAEHEAHAAQQVTPITSITSVAPAPTARPAPTATPAASPAGAPTATCGLRLVA